jgi:hypothetical protein
MSAANNTAGVFGAAGSGLFAGADRSGMLAAIGESILTTKFFQIETVISSADELSRLAQNTTPAWLTWGENESQATTAQAADNRRSINSGPRRQLASGNRSNSFATTCPTKDRPASL